MSTQPEALRLADLLEAVPFIGFVFNGQPGAEDPGLAKDAAAELRRLHAVNTELLEALQLALRSYSVMLLSDPPQEAWKTYGVEAKARAAIDKATGKHA